MTQKDIAREIGRDAGTDRADAKYLYQADTQYMNQSLLYETLPLVGARKQRAWEWYDTTILSEGYRFQYCK